MTDAITAIATLRFLGTGSCKVPQLIAFEALLAIATSSHISTATTSAAAASSTTSHITITGKMAGAIAPVARGRHRHFRIPHKFAHLTVPLSSEIISMNYQIVADDTNDTNDK